MIEDNLLYLSVVKNKKGIKNEIIYNFPNVETGAITTPMDPETNETYPRDNGYDNIILLLSLNRAFDSVLDNGIKEYYKIS